jgi:transcriptional regulator GlxA family with amidase domain
MNLSTASALSESKRQETSTRASRHIGLLLFERCCIYNAGVISEAFRLANELQPGSGGQPAYHLSLMSKSGGNISTSSSISIWTHHLHEYAVTDFDALFVACSKSEAMADHDPHLLSWLFGGERSFQDAHDRTGATTMDGTKTRPATVPMYWFKDIPMAAWSGCEAPVHLALAKIEADFGTHVARRVVSELQPQPLDHPNVMTDDLSITTTTDKIHASAGWIKENFSKSISISDAAEVAAMSNRNYLRRFKAEYGVTPQQYLMNVRFELICRLLLESDLPVDKIARRCGMGNGDRLGRLFRRRYGMSPTAYRAEGGAGVEEAHDS